MPSAQLKAVCVEAGMLALREGAKELNHEHFHGCVDMWSTSIAIGLTRSVPLHSGILEVQAKKKNDHFVSVRAAVVVISH